jgi:hypothetical protein
MLRHPRVGFVRLRRKGDWRPNLNDLVTFAGHEHCSLDNPQPISYVGFSQVDDADSRT